ncbi:MAG: protein-L-isoaspartate O-methyltransferase, partial [Aestuariivirgaceae bacterium]|nr:protein-L-isoaspartate O-methyltransferase [Aestuariivirgaceae bacterium]
MIDFVTARLNMVESQVRPNGITDSRLINAMADVPREWFVPQGREDFAYMDEDVLLARGGEQPRFMMEPMAFARLVQLADIREGDSILDVGCGTGYGLAILAQLGAKVTGLETDAALAEAARQNLAKLMLANTQVVSDGSLAEGPAGTEKFDVIFVNGRVPAFPEALARRLAPGGRMVSVEGALAMGRAYLTTLHDG